MTPFVELLLGILFISCLLWAIGLVELNANGMRIARGIIGAMAIIWLIRFAMAYHVIAR